MSNENKKMPILFVGHGSPMNAVEDNEFTKEWEKLANVIPRPKAILAISAHWYTEGTRITDALNPKTIYDMYGFPDELYQIKYNAPGAPELAHLTMDLISQEVKVDNGWGIDHGTWSILHKLYPEADIPVYQMSVNKYADAKTHYQMGKELNRLRENGVLIFASGNVVHNLRNVDWNMEGGHPWAVEFDEYIKEKIIQKDYDAVVNYEKAGKSALLSVPLPDHFFPLLYVLGAAEENDQVSVFNDACVLGGLSMTSYLFQQ